jgi:hypothetical protein
LPSRLPKFGKLGLDGIDPFELRWRQPVLDFTKAAVILAKLEVFQERFDSAGAIACFRIYRSASHSGATLLPSRRTLPLFGINGRPHPTTGGGWASMGGWID